MNKRKLEEMVKEEINKSFTLKLKNLDREVVTKHINMIYIIDKDNINIEFKSI